MSKKLTDPSIPQLTNLEPEDRFYIVDSSDNTDGNQGSSKYVTPDTIAHTLYSCSSSGTLPGSVFTVFAEEKSALNAERHEWSFGDGDASQAGFGIVLPFKAELIALTLCIRQGEATVEAKRNMDATKLSVTAGEQQGLYAVASATSSIIFTPKDVIGFKTTHAEGVTDGGKVAAWFRLI